MNLKPYAKAVAAAITTVVVPLVLAALVAGLKWIGADISVDPVSVEAVVGTVVTAIVTTVFVYLTRNAPKES